MQLSSPLPYIDKERTFFPVIPYPYFLLMLYSAQRKILAGTVGIYYTLIYLSYPFVVANDFDFFLFCTTDLLSHFFTI